jgi:hypothetical protein
LEIEITRVSLMLLMESVWRTLHSKRGGVTPPYYGRYHHLIFPSARHGKPIKVEIWYVEISEYVHILG